MVYGDLLARLIPDRCPGCDARTSSGFCRGCRADFVPVEDPCPSCGLACPVAVCPRERAPWSLDAVVAPYDYVEPVRGHLKRLKFARERRLGRALGEALAAVLAVHPTTPDIDTIIAVPLHRRRLLERGYNQAAEIAYPVAAALRVPLLRTGISRSRATAAQSLLTAAARHTNLRGAFVVSRDVRGRQVGIVDDVLTTGATLNALAAALKSAGAERVVGWTIARSL